MTGILLFVNCTVLLLLLTLSLNICISWEKNHSKINLIQKWHFHNYHDFFLETRASSFGEFCFCVPYRNFLWSLYFKFLSFGCQMPISAFEIESNPELRNVLVLNYTFLLSNMSKHQSIELNFSNRNYLVYLIHYRGTNWDSTFASKTFTALIY